ncbi:hypothetical protein [Flavobacterium sp. W22_SRS_FP1]|uniref:hypothetical protein n=1 Tax=Flavobacterium sp. W22_SRS_FP1 TaxID=3240276 RepID=UPI003F8ECB32
MKYSIEEFAQIIRNKYPKKYNDLTDPKLVELWLNKNPQDSALIKKETWGCGWYLFLLFFLWFGLTVYNVKFDKINFINNINKSVFGNNPKFINNPINENDDSNSDVIINELGSSDNEETYYDFEITQDSRDFLNNSPIIKVLKLDENTTNTLLAILSDPNPDPDNRKGDFCDNTSTRCLYCNERVPGEIYTNKNYFSNELDCDGVFSVYNFRCYTARLLMNNHSTKNDNEEIDHSGSIEEQFNSIDWRGVMNDALYESILKFKPVIENACENFKYGVKYICVENPVKEGSLNFCSEKCKTEYNYSH